MSETWVSFSGETSVVGHFVAMVVWMKGEEKRAIHIFIQCIVTFYL